MKIIHLFFLTRSILQPGTAPGQCWAFRGSTGAVVIKLLARITVKIYVYSYKAYNVINRKRTLYMKIYRYY